MNITKIIEEELGQDWKGLDSSQISVKRMHGRISV